jgi:hypothetical protein
MRRFTRDSGDGRGQKNPGSSRRVPTVPSVPTICVHTELRFHHRSQSIAHSAQRNAALIATSGDAWDSGDIVDFIEEFAPLCGDKWWGRVGTRNDSGAPLIAVTAVSVAAADVVPAPQIAAALMPITRASDVTRPIMARAPTSAARTPLRALLGVVP